jgi:hypothetical protein
MRQRDLRVATSAILAAAGVVLAAAAVAPALAAPTVFVHPDTVLVAPGEAFTMDIRVDSGTDTVTCFLVEFEFDPFVLELISAEEGSLFTECGFPTMYNWDVLGLGHHSCNDVTLGPYTYTIAPGEMVSLSFVAANPGWTSVEILAEDLRDYRRNRILPVWTEDAVVFVVPATGVPDDETPGGDRTRDGERSRGRARDHGRRAPGRSGSAGSHRR